MPLGKKKLASSSQSVARPKPIGRKNRRQKSKSKDVNHHSIRSGLRSGPLAAAIFQENPESLLSRRRKVPKCEKKNTRNVSKNSVRPQADEPVQSIETPSREENQYVTSTPSREDNSDTSEEEDFAASWSYLPPLNREFEAILDAIIADPDMAKRFTRIGPGSEAFHQGLMYRNVGLEVDPTPDSYARYIKLRLKTIDIETNEEQMLHGQLWTIDQTRCNSGSNDALFQRTLMMGLIARHLSIYNENPINRSCLDYSVEEIWTCPPMPTRAYWIGKQFLTQPKPDLAVCFRRKALISDKMWTMMPESTKRLACFENMTEKGEKRIFHFFTIEAKRAIDDDDVGKQQSLNNASQALHNMFEFFRDAGQQHEDIFFAKVRFFSVVTSTEGLIIRIHRAIKISDEESLIKDYPLKFVYQEFDRVHKYINFDRRTVLALSKKILIAYGAGKLRPLLSDAAKALMKKLENDSKGMKLREKDEYYRYGQTAKRERRKSTSVWS